MIINAFLFCLVIVACFASIAAWINTQSILKDLNETKAKLDIIEPKKTSFLDKDLDND